MCIASRAKAPEQVLDFAAMFSWLNMALCQNSQGSGHMDCPWQLHSPHHQQAFQID